jgi:hypothetical protein
VWLRIRVNHRLPAAVEVLANEQGVEPH